MAPPLSHYNKMPPLATIAHMRHLYLDILLVQSYLACHMYLFLQVLIRIVCN